MLHLTFLTPLESTLPSATSQPLCIFYAESAMCNSETCGTATLAPFLTSFFVSLNRKKPSTYSQYYIIIQEIMDIGLASIFVSFK